MSEAGPHSITPYKVGKDYTCISVVPDLERLTSVEGAVAMDPDDYSLMCRRVVDIAGCAAGKLRVSLNGLDVSFPSFEAYMKLYPSTETMMFHTINQRWSVGIGLSPHSDFESVSFVNGVSTVRGGAHVTAIEKQVIKAIQTKIAKLDDGVRQHASPQLVRRHLFVAVDSLIENPSKFNVSRFLGMSKLTSRAEF